MDLQFNLDPITTVSNYFHKFPEPIVEIIRVALENLVTQIVAYKVPARLSHTLHMLLLQNNGSPILLRAINRHKPITDS